MHRWRGLAVVLVRRVGEGSEVMLGGDLDAPQNITHESVDKLDQHCVKASSSTLDNSRVSFTCEAGESPV
jgi:hypothetical protein